MKIHINFNEQFATSVSDVNNNLVFGISWEHNDVYYPAQEWSDFGCVILGWWVRVVFQLTEGSNQEAFSFMDGPYSIQAKLDRDFKEVTLLPQKLDTIWLISFVELVQVLIEAVTNVYGELRKREIRERDQEILRKYSEILNECLSKIS